MSKPRINLFALPSQTAIFFWLITATLLGPMLIGLTGNHLIPMWPLSIILLLLPIREFILRPDREIRRYNLKVVGEAELPRLNRLVAVLSSQMGLKRTPQLLLDQKRNEIYELGSFRRWYIVLGKDKAEKLETFLADPRRTKLAEVQILHELYHFKNGDFWQLGYLAELFKTGFNLMIWVLFFMGGWGLLLILVKDAFFQFSVANLIQNMPVDLRPALQQNLSALFPSAADMEALRIKAEGINLAWVLTFIANLSLPYIFLTGFLWRFYQPLLWRMREYYADAGVVTFQKSVVPFLEFARRSKQIPLQSEPAAEGLSHTNWIRKISSQARIILNGNFWPDFSRRLGALQIPESIFYNWKQIAWFLGILILLLEIFLATPLALPIYGQNPMVFPTLVTIAGIAYFLVPQIILKKSVFRDGLRILGILLLIRTVWLTLTLAIMWGTYFVQPDFLQGVLQSAITSTARYAGNSLSELDLFSFLVKASILNLIQIPIIFAIQTIALFGLFFLLQRILHWYSFLDSSDHFKKIIFILTFGLLLVLLTTIMPMAMFLLNNEAPSILRSVLGLLVLGGGGAWFYRLDKRHYQQCPSWKHIADTEPFLGAVCPQCQTRLLPWLVTNDEN